MLPPSSIYHSPDVFLKSYAEMERKFKVFIYPDGDPNTYFQTPRKLTGKYSSEGYFFQNIRESRFRTEDADQADLFFVPISCHKMRGKVRVFEIFVLELAISNNRISRATGEMVYQKQFYRTNSFFQFAVIMSNYYDLPFNDILDWQKFSVILKESDVYQLKSILKSIPHEKFVELHEHLVEVCHH
ncbi:hypothetical protein BHE74_00044685 [Ensete ventricosum]|nr:hypothetical protein BHE74_00044685 [Ensete ventricosum]